MLCRLLAVRTAAAADEAGGDSSLIVQIAAGQSDDRIIFGRAYLWLGNAGFKFYKV
jgi:hypothetical protein